MTELLMNELQCEPCNKVFGSRKGYLVHFRKVHSQSKGVKIAASLIFCQEFGCEYKCRTLKDLRKHLSGTHNHKFSEIVKHFDNEKDFKLWLSNFEKNNDVGFIRSSQNLNAKSKVVYFKCNRSGFYKSTSRNQRVTKSQGSCKIDGHCTAYIRAKEDFRTGEVSMKICNTHYGHVLDLQHLRVPKEDRRLIEVKCNEGLSHKEILNDIKKSGPIHAERSKNIKKRDIYNVRMKINKSMNKHQCSTNFIKSDQFNDRLKNQRENINSVNIKRKIKKLKEKIVRNVDAFVRQMESLNNLSLLIHLSRKIESLSLSINSLSFDSKNSKKFSVECATSSNNVFSPFEVIDDSTVPADFTTIEVTNTSDLRNDIQPEYSADAKSPSITITNIADSISDDQQLLQCNPLVFSLSAENWLNPPENELNEQESAHELATGRICDNLSSEEFSLDRDCDGVFEEENFRLNDTILNQILASPLNSAYNI